MTRPCPCSHHLATRLLNQAPAWMPARTVLPAAGWTPATSSCVTRDTTMLYGVGPVDASGRVKNSDIVRALGWQPGDKLEVIPSLGGIVIISSPGGLFTVPVKPCIVIPAAARRIHDIQPGDHVLLAAAPEYSVVIVHTRRAVNDMLARYHSAFSPASRHHE